MDEIKIGDVVTDGIIRAEILGEGAVKFGKNFESVYKVKILSGHQRGETSIMFMNDPDIKKLNER